MTRHRVVDAVLAIVLILSLFVLSAGIVGLWVGLVIRYAWVLA